jgi:hypothetical protein
MEYKADEFGRISMNQYAETMAGRKPKRVCSAIPIGEHELVLVKPPFFGSATRLHTSLVEALESMRFELEEAEKESHAHIRLTSRFNNEEECEEFKALFAKSTRLLVQWNNQFKQWIVVLWLDYDEDTMGDSNENAHKRIRSMLRTAKKLNL